MFKMGKWHDRLIDLTMGAEAQKASALIDELGRKGVRLTRLPEGQIKVAPASRINDRERNLIRAYRSAIIMLLLMRDLGGARHKRARSANQRIGPHK